MNKINTDNDTLDNNSILSDELNQINNNITNLTSIVYTCLNNNNNYFNFPFNHRNPFIINFNHNL